MRLLLVSLLLCTLAACGAPPPEGYDAAPTKVVFVTGDEEYRSEESKP